MRMSPFNTIDSLAFLNIHKSGSLSMNVDVPDLFVAHLDVVPWPNGTMKQQITKQKRHKFWTADFISFGFFKFTDSNRPELKKLDKLE